MLLLLGHGAHNRAMSHQLAFIGAGNMAEAIARGVLRAKLFRVDQMLASDPQPQRRELFERQLGIRAVDSISEAADDARAIVVAVKPQQAAAVLDKLGLAASQDALVLSVMAGISTTFIERTMGGGAARKWRIIRAMPNTPMLVGAGMVAMARGRHASALDFAAARMLMESAAKVIEVSEDKLDAVTAVSGSGPAYFFLLVEQMIRAGVELGLTPDEARTLAVTTAQGAGAMLAGSAESPDELRRKVTSPGGTTQAAMQLLEQRGVPQAIIDAVKRAAARSKELGQ